MNYLAFAQTVIPGISANDVQYILWNRTCYPFGDVRMHYTQFHKSLRAWRSRRAMCEMCSHSEAHPCRTCQTAGLGAGNLPATERGIA